MPQQSQDPQASSPARTPSELVFSGRRSFFGVLLGVGGLAVGALLAIPLVRFLLYPLSATTTETAWSEVGSTDEFSSTTTPVRRPINVEQRDGWHKMVSEKSVYVTRGADGRLRVLSAVCPHLGCSVPWIDSKAQFICPCHGGVFAPDGSRVAGPPPRAMDSLESKIQDGRLMVRYQYFRQLVPTKEVIG